MVMMTFMDCARALTDWRTFSANLRTCARSPSLCYLSYLRFSHLVLLFVAYLSAKVPRVETCVLNVSHEEQRACTTGFL